MSLSMKERDRQRFLERQAAEKAQREAARPARRPRRRSTVASRAEQQARYIDSGWNDDLGLSPDF